MKIGKNIIELIRDDPKLQAVTPPSFSWVQSRLVQAQYWHDPLDEPLYQKGSYFLAEINNEVVSRIFVDHADTVIENPNKDRLGLQVLNKTGRLHFLAVDGDHLQFTEDWFDDNITKQFLLN
ncbi:hypothetical protein B566_EDAN010455 [Ephemera danica]|nr:hypothetical protein B566_EDAN010455 [Ephemera danica]